MHTTFMRLIGIYSIGLGCYLLLGLAVPKLRARNWHGQPAALFVLGAVGCVCLGLWAFDIARPYSWIAGVVAWGIGFLIQRRIPRESGVAPEKIMDRREAMLALVLLVGIIAVMLRVFLG